MSLRKTRNKQFEVILERLQKQDSYREKQIANGWTEEKCRYLDQLALEDKSDTATRKERQRYENNWKLALNAHGLVSPMDKREDCCEAVKAIRNLRQQDEQPSNPPIRPSYQTRSRPFQERHQERQWNSQTWSNSPSPSSSVWWSSSEPSSWWSSSEWQEY